MGRPHSVTIAVPPLGAVVLVLESLDEDANPLPGEESSDEALNADGQ